LKLAALLFLAALGLCGCAGAPVIKGDFAGRDALQDFSLEARFALRLERPGEAVQSASGRLSWQHENASDQVLLSTPMGSGIAEIRLSPGLAILQTAEGEIHQAADADALLQQVTGYGLPVSRLANWLLGRAGADGQLERDRQQRPLRLREGGWQVDYAYEDDMENALPARLTVARAPEMELRLRIESWQVAP
jgi:outer membrane lipoprotein LolB